MEKERKEHHQSKKFISSTVSSILPDHRPIERYTGPGLGIWNLTPDTYISTKPEYRNIPDLPWLYGPCKPKLLPIAQDRYEGWMEWMDGEEMYYGCQYQLEVLEGVIQLPEEISGEKRDRVFCTN